MIDLYAIPVWRKILQNNIIKIHLDHIIGLVEHHLFFKLLSQELSMPFPCYSGNPC